MSLLKHQNSTNWYYRFILNGKIHFGSTKTSNKTLAAKVERAKYEAALAKIELGDKPTITTHDALHQFLATQEQMGEYKNIKTYVHKMLGQKFNTRNQDREVIEIYGFEPDSLFHELDNSDVQKLILARRKERNADATILTELVQLSKAIRLIDKLGYMTPNIALRELKRENKLQPTKKKLRYLSIQEEQQLLASLDPSGLFHPETRSERSDMRDLVICLLDTGARYNEIASIKWADIDLKEKTISLYRSKTNNQSVLSMTARVHSHLLTRMESKRADQVYVFEDSTHTTHRKYAPKAFNDACKRSGIQGITLHALRKTHASRLVQAGIPLYDVSKLLGHSSVNTTAAHYAHLAPNHASVKAVEVLDKLQGVES